MNLSYCVEELSANATVVQRIVEAVDGDQARWKPTPDDWSVLEVINHLLDEEREDFRPRLQHLLSGAAGPWPPITPLKWVVERAYNRRNLDESVANYLQERQHSLAWLASLTGVDWQAAYRHRPLEGLSAGGLLVAWTAHDVLHLRQLIELKWAYGRTQYAPFVPDYAGEW